MKKSLLALAVAFAATNASAVTVYDKDNTSFAVGGRVQSVAYNGAYETAGDHDAGLVNSARLNLSGNTKINDYVSVFAFSEWNMADGNNAETGDNINTRDQYVGADFGSFGKILAGKAFDALYAVQAATDVFEDTACIDNATAADRRTGMFRYVYDNNGFFASASYNTASDGVLLGTTDDGKVDVEYGYAASAGYTFDNVAFGPLSIKGGYSYVEGQDDKFNYFKDFENTAFSVTWGSLDSGLYLAALYNAHNTTYVPQFKECTKGYELVAGYAFDFGLTVLTGYEVRDIKYKVINSGLVSPSTLVRRVPVLVNYQVAPSFNIWTEAEFDANSDSYEDRGTKFSAGARYTF